LMCQGLKKKLIKFYAVKYLQVTHFQKEKVKFVHIMFNIITF